MEAHEMALHELAKTWKSQTGPKMNNVDPAALSDDIDGDFDLRRMLDDGEAAGTSTHGNQTIGQLPISGKTVKIVNVPEAPHARYLVRFDQQPSPGLTFRYRGVAIWNPALNEITKIVGVKIVRASAAPGPAETPKRKGEALLAGQDEATWVATKNP